MISPQMNTNETQIESVLICKICAQSLIFYLCYICAHLWLKEFAHSSDLWHFIVTGKLIYYEQT